MKYKNNRLSVQQISNAWSVEIKNLRVDSKSVGISLFHRFQKIYQQFNEQPRAIRRRLQGRGKITLSRAAMLLALGCALPASAANIAVNTLVPDVDASDGKCSLIEAIENANVDSALHSDCTKGNGADTIRLQENSVHTLTKIHNERGTSYERFANGLPVITGNITIEGMNSTIQRFTDGKAGANDDNAAFNLFEVSQTGDLSLENLSLKGGGGYYDDGFIGRGARIYRSSYIGLSSAIMNNGIVALSNVSVSENNSDESTIANKGTMIIESSKLIDNGGFDSSPTVDNFELGQLTISKSLLKSHKQVLRNSGELDFVNSTVSGAASIGYAPVMRNHGLMKIRQSTISGNRSIMTNDFYGPTSGEIILNHSGANLELSNSIVSGNTLTKGPFLAYDSQYYAFSPGKLRNVVIYNRGAITSKNNILGDSDVYFTSPDEYLEPSFAFGFTPDSTDIVTTVDGNQPATVEEIFGGDFALKNNGGPTETYALSPAGLAVDAASAGDCPTTDQRGLSRPQGARCDIGSYELPVSTIGDFVWKDIDGDGIQDNGEPGLINVTVHLQTCSGSTIDTTTTNSTGQFTFTGMDPGRYQMQFVLPGNHTFSPEKAGTDTRLDSNADPVTGITACYNMPQGKYRRAIDAGMVPASIETGTGLMGDYIWQDTNGNGIQDNNESGLANVAIDLLTCDGNSLMSTTSDSNGAYQFGHLASGHYRMQFHTPADYRFSPEKATDLFKLDSNANVTTGLTGCYDMTQGWKRRAIDVGMVPDDNASMDAVTLVKAIYFSADNKLWIRAQSDASPAGTADITATMTVNGNEQTVGTIGWKGNKGFYQQVFFNITQAPTSITLASDQGGVVTGAVEVR